MKPVQEEDVVRSPRILQLAGVTVLSMVLGVALAWVLGASRAHQLGARFLHTEPSGPPAKHLRELRLGTFDPRDHPNAAPPPDRLERYGWVDREGGVVHIPIEAAIDLEVAQEARP
jgi:hypothetical protein